MTTQTLEKNPLLPTMLSAMKQTKPKQSMSLLNALVENALNDTVQWDHNIVNSIQSAIEKIDAIISEQLANIMHTPIFSRLEGSWRGLNYLVKNSKSHPSLKIKVLSISKEEVEKDLNKAIEFDQSELFKKVYENEFGMPGGEPYGALIGDYFFNHHPRDLAILNKIAGVAASAFCPFISAADASMMGFDDWSDLSKPRDLSKIFDSTDYIQWRHFRESEDARFVTLTLPRVLARLPYGNNTQPIEAFHFEEGYDHYCWMNAGYVLGEKLAHAFAEHGWCTAIRGAEGGGKVKNLPMHVFATDDGDVDLQCPTEVGITDRRESELSQLGFLPLCHYKNTDYAVFFGAETTQAARQYDTHEATANAAISARLPYIIATSRFAHYLKIMARDKIGSFMEIEDVEHWLNRWILNYVNGNAHSKQSLKAKYPLAEAKITVKPTPGRPGSYHAIAWLRPWLQMEALTTSMRLVANIPSFE